MNNKQQYKKEQWGTPMKNLCLKKLKYTFRV